MIEWIVSGDTGVSSETLWAALMGVSKTDYEGHPFNDIPADTGKFGRCYRLVKNVTSQKKNLETL